MSADPQGVLPLPGGHHGLTRAQVTMSQRERLVAATIAGVGEHGLPAASVADIIRRARVSRGTFYEHFTNKEECFLAALDAIAQALVADLWTLGADAEDWVSGLRDGTRGYLRWWDDHPDAARCFFIEAPAGTRSAACRDDLLERFHRLFAAVGSRARNEQAGLPPLPSIVPKAVVGAVVELTASAFRRAGGASLADLEDDLLYVQLALLSDHATASAAVRAGSG